MHRVLSVIAALSLGLVLAACRAPSQPAAERFPAKAPAWGSASAPVFETHLLANGAAPITLNLAFCPGTVARHPVILMLGALQTNQLPDWSTNLVREGYMLAAFSAAHPPDPDPARRAQWLFFDQRFAHSYVLGAQRAIADSRCVLTWLARRDDVDSAKVGWLGSSSTGIPGLAVATQGPRLAAVVAFVSTGAYQQWFDTWQPNGLWRGTNYALWPETGALLRQYDPILHATNLFPTALLLVSGGQDKVVDPKTARAFVEAARPAYESDPERLRLVLYEGFGHNLPADVVRLYAEHWFHLYLSPSNPPPHSPAASTNLAQSVVRSQINAADHRDVLGVGARPSSGAATSKSQGVQKLSNAPALSQLAAPGDGRTPVLEFIRVTKDGRGFAQASSGKPFTPWGFNYDRDYKSRLLEDYWNAEWPTVVEDLGEMKALGANVVRIHLQFARFMDGPTQSNPQALAQLARLVKLAEETGLYLDLTGLACYRRKDVPAWYAALSETDRWAAQARFWQAVATTCAGSPAVFCYDLANEPIVPTGKRQAGDWQVGDLGGFTYCQFISLDQADRPRPEIARKWIAKLAAVIRRCDSRHLITAGLLPNSLETPVSESGFAPQKVAGPLDFVCVHLYPVSGHSKQDLALLHGFQVGKPVVIEEMFPLTCTVAELAEFIRASKPDASGWVGFYWGQTPVELDRATDLSAKLTADWLRLFQTLNPNRAN